MSGVPHESMLKKLKDIKGLKQLMLAALLLYALLLDADCPAWAKTVVVAALLYLLNPFDAMPDPLIWAGYIDDLAVLMSAIAALSNVIKPHHHASASQMHTEI
ncbi:YkvA family protein [Rheinheimera sp.]|uniref:YkvA family protein n=1 Tax=Rheinheimera sp. TaxID=1869214 RepID=UPI002FDEDED3